MENRKRNIQMKFYVTEEEKRLIDEKMKQLPIKQYGAYFRKMAIDGYILVVDRSDTKAYIRELQAVSRNINQIAKRANATGTVYRQDIEDIKKAVDEIWRLQRRTLWEPYIPFGKVTIVQGNPGEGKTTFALRLAAACTTGGTLPGMKPLPPFQVIYQTAEDGLGDTVKPRLIEAEADLDRVLVIDEAKRELTVWMDFSAGHRTNYSRCCYLIIAAMRNCG